MDLVAYGVSLDRLLNQAYVFHLLDFSLFVCKFNRVLFCFVFQYNLMGESSELFVNCLEAMVETCLPIEETAVPPPRPYHLSSSLSSLTLGSPTDKGSI